MFKSKKLWLGLGLAITAAGATAVAVSCSSDSASSLSLASSYDVSSSSVISSLKSAVDSYTKYDATSEESSYNTSSSSSIITFKDDASKVNYLEYNWYSSLTNYFKSANNDISKAFTSVSSRSQNGFNYTESSPVVTGAEITSSSDSTTSITLKLTITSFSTSYNVEESTSSEGYSTYKRVNYTVTKGSSVTKTVTLNVKSS